MKYEYSIWRDNGYAPADSIKEWTQIEQGDSEDTQECTNSCNDGAYCTWNGDCYINTGLGQCYIGTCITTEQVWLCDDVYECEEYTTYDCP